MGDSGIEDEEEEDNWEDRFDEEEYWSSVEDELPEDSGDDGDGELSDQSDESGGDTEWAQRGRQHRREGCRRKSKSKGKGKAREGKIKGKEHLSDAETESLRLLRASERRQTRHTNEMWKIMKLRPDIIPEIINRLMLKCNPGDRERLRGLGGVQQEKYLAVRSAVATMEKECFNARNSMDLRSNEALSISTVNNIRDRLGKDKHGKRVVLMQAPDYKGDCNPLTRKNNEEQGIKWAKGEVRVPFPLKNSQQIRAAGEEVLKGRQLYLGDDMDGCAWDTTDMMGDVLHQAEKDNNLLPLPPGNSHAHASRPSPTFNSLRARGAIGCGPGTNTRRT